MNVMTLERESALTQKARDAHKVSTTCVHHNAERRADALAVAAAAMAEGIFEPSQQMLDEISHLAQAIVWDLAVAL